MAFKFEELKVWQVSLKLSNEIDTIAKNFPRIELFSLANQIKKAADSVNLNIAEGCMGQSKAEFSRFFNLFGTFWIGGGKLSIYGVFKRLYYRN